MAAYLTRDEFKAMGVPADAVAGLTDSQLDAALSWASSQADSWLRKRYALPLVSYGDDLRQAVAALARWHVFSFRGIRPGAGYQEMARLAYEDAIAWLRDVAKGLVQIAGVDSTPEVDEEGSLVVAGPPPVSFRMVTGSNPVCNSCGCLDCDCG